METMSMTHPADSYRPPPGTPTPGFSVYSYKDGEKGQRPFWVPNDHNESRHAMSERRYRVNPELIPLIKGRHDTTSAGSRQVKGRSLPRTPGTVSEFETECIRKLWNELVPNERQHLPENHKPKLRTPEIKLGERSMTLAELESRAGLSRSGFVERSGSDVRNRGPGPLGPGDIPTTIREQRALRRELKTAKFYTAFNRPVSKKQVFAPIRALTQVAPSVPHLVGLRPSTQSYQQRDLTIWQNEVKKVVPVRPSLSVPTALKTKNHGDFHEEYNKVSHPVFYDAKKPAPPREYAVNVEWFSDTRPPRKKQATNRFW